MKNLCAITLLLSAGMASTALAQADKGPSTASSSYMLPSSTTSGVRFVSIATTGGTAGVPDDVFVRLQRNADGTITPTSTQTPYRLVGLPDGMGGYRTEQDIAEGTFTLLVNHENGGTSGPINAWGQRGAHFSLWRVNANPANLFVLGGMPAADKARLWNSATQTYTTYDAANAMPSALAFSRHCSGDLAPTSAYRFGSLGTDERIYMTGEEIGANGRVFGYVLSGPNAGTAIQLPQHGQYSWENNVANPHPMAKTICVGTDDATPGEVLFYVGQKTDTGSEIERAGLTNGRVYGLVVADAPGNPVSVNGAGQKVESGTFALGSTALRSSARFSVYQYSDQTNKTGSQLQTESNTAGVLQFLRPEDACWDLKDPSVCYFMTTTPSHVWRVKFDNINDITLGGEITLLVDGGSLAATTSSITSPTGLTDIVAADNMYVTRNGLMYIQEDVGNNSRLGRIWQYNIATDAVKEIGIPDASRFLSGGSRFLTQDEETSGIFDARDLLGAGWHLLCIQAHYGIAQNDLVEGGQLMAMFDPDSVKLCEFDVAGANQSTVADGALSADDIIVFLGWYFANDARADIAGLNQSSTPDAQFTADDIIVYLGGFFSGCR